MIFYHNVLKLENKIRQTEIFTNMWKLKNIKLNENTKIYEMQLKQLRRKFIAENTYFEKKKDIK